MNLWTLPSSMGVTPSSASLGPLCEVEAIAGRYAFDRVYGHGLHIARRGTTGDRVRAGGQVERWQRRRTARLAVDDDDAGAWGCRDEDTSHPPYRIRHSRRRHGKRIDRHYRRIGDL